MQIKFGVPPKPIFVLSSFLSLDYYLLADLNKFFWVSRNPIFMLHPRWSSNQTEYVSIKFSVEIILDHHLGWREQLIYFVSSNINSSIRWIEMMKTFQVQTIFVLDPRCSSNQTEFVLIQVLCCENTWSSPRLNRTINLLRIKQ
jgi:hypothetical protein